MSSMVTYHTARLEDNMTAHHEHHEEPTPTKKTDELLKVVSLMLRNKLIAISIAIFILSCAYAVAFRDIISEYVSVGVTPSTHQRH